MREQKEVITCDICGNEITNGDIAYDFEISYYELGHVAVAAYDDVCPTCVKKFSELIKLIKSQRSL